MIKTSFRPKEKDPDADIWLFQQRIDSDKKGCNLHLKVEEKKESPFEILEDGALKLGEETRWVARERGKGPTHLRSDVQWEKFFFTTSPFFSCSLTKTRDV